MFKIPASSSPLARTKGRSPDQPSAGALQCLCSRFQHQVLHWLEPKEDLQTSLQRELFNAYVQDSSIKFSIGSNQRKISRPAFSGSSSMPMFKIPASSSPLARTKGRSPDQPSA